MNYSARLLKLNDIYAKLIFIINLTGYLFILILNYVYIRSLAIYLLFVMMKIKQYFISIFAIIICYNSTIIFSFLLNKILAIHSLIARHLSIYLKNKRHLKTLILISSFDGRFLTGFFQGTLNSIVVPFCLACLFLGKYKTHKTHIENLTSYIKKNKKFFIYSWIDIQNLVSSF